MSLPRNGLLSVSWTLGAVLVLSFVIIALLAILSSVTFDARAARTDIALQGPVDTIDRWCARGTDQRTLTLELPQTVESVVIDGDATYRASVQDGSTVTMAAESCERVRICADGASGPDCSTGGALSGGTVEVTLYVENGEAIIDPST